MHGLVARPGAIGAGFGSRGLFRRLGSPPPASRGGKRPAELDSISFVPTLLGNGQAQRSHEYLYWEFHEGGFSQAALYQGRWKAIRERSLSAPLKLYDLREDIAEQTDLAAALPDLAGRLDDYLQTARSESTDWPAR